MNKYNYVVSLWRRVSNSIHYLLSIDNALSNFFFFFFLEYSYFVFVLKVFDFTIG
jgi:hypothetical protein